MTITSALVSNDWTGLTSKLERNIHMNKNVPLVYFTTSPTPLSLHLLMISSHNILKASIRLTATIIIMSIASTFAVALSPPKTPSPAVTFLNKGQPLLIGYCHDAHSKKLPEAIENGIDVIIWSFVHMAIDPWGFPIIQTDLDLPQIQHIRQQNGQRDIIHMAAFGGWNGPHPHPGVTGKEWCKAFIKFNKRHGNLFDGIDWDLEGHDDRSSPTSRFTLEALDVMADFSTEAKEKFGLLVSLAPAESYLDALWKEEEGNVNFSLNLNLFPLWSNADEKTSQMIANSGFAHAGRQCYAYVLHKAGIDVFDWISLQYYESHSRFVFDTKHSKTNPLTQANALVERAEAMDDGFFVDLPHFGRVRIFVPIEKLVFGFANGWADGVKVVKVDTSSVKEAFNLLKIKRKGRVPGGVMFWTIEEEGKDGIFLSSSLESAIRGNIEEIKSNQEL